MQEIVLALQEYILSAGPWGPVVYIVAMAIAIVVSPIPSSPLAIFAGAIFGWVWAFVWTMIGAILGALMAFYIARVFGRPIIEKFIFKDKLEEIENMLPEKHLTWGIFLLRLPPLPFFDAVSYAAGLTKISFRNFTIATFFGLIPLVFIFSYFGELATNLTYLSIAVIIISILFFLFIRCFTKNHTKY